MQPAAYQTAGVQFSYGAEPVLRGVEMRLETGGFGALLGPNGSGKSTLLRLLLGRLTPDGGDILLDGRALGTVPPPERARLVGYLPQEVQSAYRYTVREVVLMGRFPHLSFGLERPRDLEVAADCLRRTHTEHLSERDFTTLSGGEKQRVLLASVLAQEPRILLLDEPTAALDIHHQHEVMELLDGLHRDGLSILLVTHDLNLAARYCPTLWLLEAGQIVVTGGPAEVLTEARLRAVYGDRLRVTADPDLGGPLVLPPLPEVP